MSKINKKQPKRLYQVVLMEEGYHYLTLFTIARSKEEAQEKMTMRIMEEGRDKIIDILKSRPKLKINTILVDDVDGHKVHLVKPRKRKDEET